MEKGRLIRLNDNWVSVAINHLDHFGDVGYLDFRFLEKLLPHCTKEQLLHIEKSTKKVDLSPITNKLWMKFFEKDFGCKATDEMIQLMKINKLGCRWLELYQEKSKRRKRAEKQVSQKLKKLYGCKSGSGSESSIEASQNIDAEVLRIKEVLQNSEKDKANEASMIDSLTRLKMMAMTVETLEATNIGKVVSGLKKHGSKQISDLARTVVDGWKVMVDEYLSTQNAKKESSSDVVCQQNKNELAAAIKKQEVVAVKPNKASNNNEGNMRCLDDEAAKAKIGATKRKLHESYEQIETAKKQRRIQVLDDIPKQGPKVGSHTTNQHERNTKASTPWMKKLRKSYQNSLECRNLQAMKRMKKVV